MKSFKNIILISSFDFDPIKDAGLVRMMNYSYSLKRKKINLFFTSSADNKYYALDENKCLSQAGYLSKNNNRILFTKLYSLFLNEFSFIKNYKYLKRVLSEFNDSKQRNVYLFYPGSFSMYIVIIFYLRFIKGQEVYLEKNELEFAVRLNYEPPLSFSKKFLFYTLQFMLIPISFLKDILSVFFDGIIVISNRMCKLYSATNKVILIPILSFRNIHISKTDTNMNDKFSISYFGSISNQKDETFNLIEAIGSNHELYNQIRLDLFGHYNNSTSKRINHLIDKFNLQNIVFLNNSISNDKVYRKMEESDLLIALRPDSLQNNYGFSTKLAEYAQSMTPILLTDVSDVSYYFSDKLNAFIINRSKVGVYDIDKALLKIINLPAKKRKIIADNAYEVYRKYFDPLVYSTELELFMYEKN